MMDLFLYLLIPAFFIFWSLLCFIDLEDLMTLTAHALARSS